MTWVLAFATLGIVGWLAYDYGWDRGYDAASEQFDGEEA